MSFSLVSMELETELGKLFSNLEPVRASQTGIYELPPCGAARLKLKTESHFDWEPIGPEEWKNMTPTERGDVLLSRGRSWLDTNAEVKASPVAFVDISAISPQQTEQMFGKVGSNLKETICAVHRLVETKKLTTDAAVILLGATLHAITGLYVTAVAPEVSILLLRAYAHHFGSR